MAGGGLTHNLNTTAAGALNHKLNTMAARTLTHKLNTTAAWGPHSQAEYNSFGCCQPHSQAEYNGCWRPHSQVEYNLYPTVNGLGGFAWLNCLLKWSHLLLQGLTINV